MSNLKTKKGQKVCHQSVHFVFYCKKILVFPDCIFVNIFAFVNIKLPKTNIIYCSFNGNEFPMHFTDNILNKYYPKLFTHSITTTNTSATNTRSTTKNRTITIITTTNTRSTTKNRTNTINTTKTTTTTNTNITTTTTTNT